MTKNLFPLLGIIIFASEQYYFHWIANVDF